mgnify:CR=1 FL=1
MKIFVKAKPNAPETKVEKSDKTHFVVSEKEPPVRGLANQAIIKALGEHFGVAGSNVKILSGFTSRQKIIDIKTEP